MRISNIKRRARGQDHTILAISRPRTDVVYIAGQRKTNLVFPGDSASMSKRTKNSAPKRMLTEKTYLCIKEGIVPGEIEEGECRHFPRGEPRVR